MEVLAQAEAIHPSYRVDDDEDRITIEELDEDTEIPPPQHNDQHPTSILRRPNSNQNAQISRNHAIVLHPGEMERVTNQTSQPNDDQEVSPIRGLNPVPVQYDPQNEQRNADRSASNSASARYELSQRTEVVLKSYLTGERMLGIRDLETLGQVQALKALVSTAAFNAARSCGERMEDDPVYLSSQWAVLPMSRLIEASNKDNVARQVRRELASATEPNISEFHIHPLTWPDMYMNPAAINGIKSG
jgi:hypothetical protein